MEATVKFRQMPSMQTLTLTVVEYAIGKATQPLNRADSCAKSRDQARSPMALSAIIDTPTALPTRQRLA